MVSPHLVEKDRGSRGAKYAFSDTHPERPGQVVHSQETKV
jgi:hypothetical protein